ncbi:MAG: RICIN domain-containing protein, partial [Dysgonamonadaceae bacterium]|nr:RICIN domain-containing protein [Dysgonamonadaceae bacterium]
KARLKLGWTISPAFAELAPALYKKYIENALTTDGARNYLVAGPSGAGYYFPSIYPQLAAQNAFMNRMLKKADLNIVNIIDKDGNHNPDEYLKQSNVDALFYYSYGGQYTQLAGQIKWYQGKPSIGGRFTLWGNSDDGSAATRERVCQNLANTLNSQSTNINSASGYSLIPVHIWTMNPSDVLNVINKLNPNIRVVSPDEFVWLIRKNVGQVNIANGNGLSAEYELLSNPGHPILTVGEPTVDFDDEYLTEATATLGNNAFTARWTGKVQAVYSQEYTFHSTATGGVFLKINGRILCDSIDNSTVNSSDTITLVAGEKYDLELVYRKNGGKAQVMLEWESSSQTRQRIPRYQLFSRPQPTSGLVTAYDIENYTGYSATLKFGSYDSSALEKAGFGQQALKSLKITNGFKVILFSENNFTGDSIEVTANDPDLGAWIDKTASLKVMADGSGLPEGVYQIISTANSNTVAIEGDYANADNGQKARLARNTGNLNMQFRFSKLGDGTYRIQPLSSGKSLEIADFSQDDNAVVQQWKTSNDAENQKFIIVPATGENVYRMYSYFSEKMIEAASSSSAALIRQTSNQNSSNALWQFEPVAPLLDGRGNGLTGEYYNGLNFNTLRVTQIDTVINFNWGTGKPHRDVNIDNFSVRWQGKIEPRAAGEYTFFVNSDNGRRLWINDQLIIDQWIDNYDIEYFGTISLQAGQRYNIKLEYFESAGGAYCRLEWLGQKQVREIVPPSQLYSLDYDYSGMENPETAGFLTIYPNPAKDELYLNIPNLEYSQSIEILDLSGKQMIIGKFVPGKSIPVSHLATGIYIVKIGNFRGKFVKK